MKTILIVTGSTILILLLGFWVYLLLFNSPESIDDVFVDLGLKNGATERPLLITEINDNSANLTITEALNQLTVKPVAGYIVVNRPTERLRYAERGTGHIYEINFTTNIETRLVGNTFAKTNEAYFSPDGLLVALVRESETGTAATLMTIPENTGASAVSTELPDNIREIEVVSSTTVKYLKTIDNQSVAYSFNRLTGTASELWRIPLTDINVWWGINRTYVVTKPAPSLAGAVYEVTGNGQLVPITEQGFAYTALFNEPTGDIIETKYDSETESLASVKINLTSSVAKEIAVLAIPEKCTFKPNNNNSLWCGALAPDNQSQRRDFMKDWYMGTVSSEDFLWEVDLNNQVSQIAVDFLSQAGVRIDVISPTFNPAGNRLFFINKINDTLWLYQIP